MTRLIICESTGRWAVALRRELAGRREVYETRSVAECFEALAKAPASFAIVELSRGNAEALAARVADLERDFPLARLAVVASGELADYQWLMREAGAVCFVTSPRRLAPLAEAACRHLDQAPTPQQTLVERIWDELPWGGGIDN